MCVLPWGKVYGVFNAKYVYLFNFLRRPILANLQVQMFLVSGIVLVSSLSLVRVVGP